MHVLITTDAIGGVWNYTRELVCGLSTRGHQIALISFGRVPADEEVLWTRRDGVTYYPTDFPLEWMDDSEVSIAKSVVYLCDIVRAIKPDVVHTNQICYGALPSDVPKVVVVHSDVVSWWHAVYNCDPPPSRWTTWYRASVSRGLSHADVVVTPSEWMRQAVFRHYVRPEWTQVIYNGRSAERFCPTRTKTDCILSVGRLWDQGKQLSLLLACRHLTPVRIVGSAKHPTQPTADFLASHQPNVTMFGEQGEQLLRDLYSDSSIYVATSQYEPFGLALLEAALSRCALIANDIPTVREIWGEAAYYFHQNDSTSLTAAIERMAGDHGLREEYANRAYAHATRHYTAERMVRQYEELYRALLDERTTA